MREQMLLAVEIVIGVGLWLFFIVNMFRLAWMIWHGPVIQKKIQAIWKWRMENLFCTPAEVDTIVFEVRKTCASDAMDKLSETITRLNMKFMELQSIQVDVNGRSQLMDIRLLLDRKALRVFDVEDAADLLAARTKIIYVEAIKKRLAERETKQPKEIK